MVLMWLGLLISIGILGAIIKLISPLAAAACILALIDMHLQQRRYVELIFLVADSLEDADVALEEEIGL